MRLSDLRDKPLRSEDGKSLGRVHEVHCEKGRVVALMCGAPSFIERLTAKPHGRRIPWEQVVEVARDRIVIRDEASGARIPPGTRRASAQRSKR